MKQSGAGKQVWVAVGVVENTQGEILIAKRPDHLHQGGKWEFPGGKVDAGETVEQALSRELKEEVALEVHSMQPLMQITHDYGDKQVLLDILWVDGFSGEAQGLEGQPVRWVAKTDLDSYQFPEANQPIIEKILAG